MHLFLISATLSAVQSLPSYAASTVVSDIRIGQNKARTRFVIEANRKITYKIFTLANPNRVVIDINEVSWKNDAGGAKGKGVIDKYRYGLFKPGTSRIVLDLKSPAIINKSFTINAKGKNGHRFVLDLKPSSQKKFEQLVRKPAIRTGKRASLPDISPEDKRRNRLKKLIVIDPGHGGHDPGNLGTRERSVVPEKTVVLSAAKEIKRALERTGRYEVIMTRNRDIFLKLRSRSRIAHNNQADLFISVHADSIKNKSVRGATVYTLSEKASDREAAAMAARENKSDIIAGMDLEDEIDIVQTILIDLVKRETMNLSSNFASELVPQLKKVVKVRTNPHRTAGLIVLKGLDVPSVLVELGYLTNRQDAKILMQKETQQKIANSIVVATDRFFQKYVATY